MKYKTAVNKLKKIAKGRYCSIQYQRTYFDSDKSQQECGVYLDGYNWYYNPTWEQSLKLLEQAVNNPSANDNDAPINELKTKKEDET